ncbi:hypothetical protein GE09DRAFT_1054570 [Coniochaeta sp. 2T2.1]|nr:hypothetical protein GE09DRAFT_1054570 [Coniochaeta sp. 2T2.1]
MIFKALSASIIVASAAALEVVHFQTQGTTLDLGGASTQQDYGYIYRTDSSQPWESLDMNSEIDICSYICDDFGFYDLGGQPVGACHEGYSCIAGDDYTCKYSHNGQVYAFTSNTDHEMYGLGHSTATYCGGYVG